MEDIKMEKDKGNLLLGWQIPEYEKYERGKNWYVWAGIIFALMILYALYTLNFLFIVILILAAVTIVLRIMGEPAKIGFSIFEDGIEVGSKFYPWRDLDKFFIIYEPPEIKSLYFDPKGLRSRISIPIENQNPLKIREILLKYLVEDLEQEREPLAEEYGRFFKI